MTTSNRTALVVEDEKLQSWSLGKSLAKWGFMVRSVFTGSDAVAQVEKSGYDIILLDYQLPDCNGLEVARRVRQIQPGAVIFLVTAFQLNELPAHAGLIDAYFNKPLDLQQLQQALDRLPLWNEAARS
jgi:CheY-like chemotaxis protein